MYITMSLYVDGHFGYFHFLSVVDNVAMNMGIQISLQYAVFIFLDVYRGEIAESYGSSSFNLGEPPYCFPE